jgi:benzil reductase ((S)-benzoin forming)
MIIITGTSSGIGKALAELYLGEGKSVVGIGRNHTIAHPAYHPVVCDLSDETAISGLSLEPFVNDEVLLINNAGMLGNVKRISDQDKPDIATVLAVNTIAPLILMNRLAQLCGDRFPLTVVNISSGAASRAIPSWAAYCASKAALEMLSETFYLEEREKGRSTKVYAVAPGVVDTNMQAHIRAVGPEDFSASQTFHGYKETGELASPEVVARKLDKLLKLNYTGVVAHSLRSVELDQ